MVEGDLCGEKVVISILAFLPWTEKQQFIDATQDVDHGTKIGQEELLDVKKGAHDY